MAIPITTKSYPKYSHAQYNFRRAIQDPNSQLRKLIEMVDTDRVINRFDFYMETRGHRNGDLGWAFIDVRRNIRVRPGYGSSFWTALVNAGVLINSGKRNDNGYMEYLPGRNYDLYSEMARFFTKTSRDHRWFYGETNEIPDGWEIDFDHFMFRKYEDVGQS